MVNGIECFGQIEKGGYCCVVNVEDAVDSLKE